MITTSEQRDQVICGKLRTSVTALQTILGKSRQTIAKHMAEGKLFGADEVVKVANITIDDNDERTQIVSEILTDYFPDVVRYANDAIVDRFQKYCILGMNIQPELIANDVFRAFVIKILSDQQKLVLFACLPQKEYVLLSRWLDEFRVERQSRRLATFVVLPCKLVELAPIQILAEPWSEEPKLIQFNRKEIFVDNSNSNRAKQLASALREYGVSDQACESIQHEDVRKRLAEGVNNSIYGPVKEPVRYYKPGFNRIEG